MALLWKSCAILIFSLAVYAKPPALPKVASESKFKKERIKIAGKVISVEIAESEEQHELGLMYRKSLGKNDGMLFIFPIEKPLYFWMKNTFIDLSIGYFDKNAVLIKIQEMKATSVMESAPPSYPSTKAAKFALEMNKGWFAKNEIKIGAKIKFLESRH